MESIRGETCILLSDTQAALKALDSFPVELLGPVCNPCRYWENITGYV